MTFDEAVKLIQERAEELSKDPIFQKALLKKGFTKTEDAIAFCHQVAIATLYGDPAYPQV